MARISPLDDQEADPAARAVLEAMASASGGVMEARNLFNNALRVDLDDDLRPYRKEDGQ